MGNKISLMFANSHKQSEKSFEIDRLIFVYLVYIAFIWINDIICFIANSKGIIITYMISLVVIFIATMILLKRSNLTVPDFHSTDIVFVCAIFFICALRIAIPDTSYDTVNYHVYMQERPFANNVAQNFFPCSWAGSYSFPLADRMFFPIRRILGYRLGPSLNAAILALIYFQCKRFIKSLNPDVSNFVRSYIAGASILTEQILTQLCIYYVDLLAIPLFLEILIRIQEKRSTDKDCLYLCVLGGFSIALKLPNLIFVAIFAVIYFLQNYKTIKWPTVVMGIIFILLPIGLPYAINTYVQTGNPIFPYYNTIFKSPYLDNIKSLEGIRERFGPKTIFELLLWPVVIFFEPLRTYDTPVYWGRLSLSYICAIFWGCRYFVLKIRKKEVGNVLYRLSIIYIICCLMWGQFMAGMVRYALTLEVWGGIIVFLTIRECHRFQKRFYPCVAAALCFAFVFQCSESLHTVLLSYQEPGWRNSVLVDADYYGANFEYLFTEYDYDEYLEGIDCFCCVTFNASMAALLSDDIPVVSLNGWYANSYSTEKFRSVLSQYHNIYIISTLGNMQYTLDKAAEIGVSVTDEVRTFAVDFISSTDALCLIKLEGTGQSLLSNLVVP